MYFVAKYFASTIVYKASIENTAVRIYLGNFMELNNLIPPNASNLIHKTLLF